MYIEHNSHSQFYRSPFGSSVCNSEVRLSVAVGECGIPNNVKLMTNIGEYNMYYTDTIGEYDIYSVTLKMPEKPCKVYYHFEIDTYDGRFYYGNQGFGGVGELLTEPPHRAYQITVCSADYKTPDWFKRSVCYQIFPDRFYRSGDFLCDKPYAKKRLWGEVPFYKQSQFGKVYDCSDFFGGNLKGIEEKLPYLADLGIGVIYLNPIFAAYSNHRYDTGDYEKIDPMLGTEADFVSLCSEAEKLGIRIILDGVFNHTGSDSKYFNKNGNYPSVGAYQSTESPYYNWYRFFEYPQKYESWWGMETLPQVEENNEEYRKYILSGEAAIVKKWLRCGGSGWRLDVADELPDSFIKELRKNVKAEKSDAVIIGEVWEDASNKIAYGEEREYLLGDELDSVMNYPLRTALIDFALERIGGEEFDMRLTSLRENYPKEAFYSLLNFLSSHDVERILTCLGDIYPETKDEMAQFKLSGEALFEAKARLEAIYKILFTLPGVPCLFYGDEVGVEGFGDPFCRSCFPWDDGDMEIYETVKKLIALRNSSPCLTDGDLETVYSYSGGYGFLRSLNSERMLTLSSFGGEECMRVDLARFGITSIESTSGEVYTSENGIFFVNMPQIGTKIFKCRKSIACECRNRA